jgi:hypothetical protein
MRKEGASAITIVHDATIVLCGIHDFRLSAAIVSSKRISYGFSFPDGLCLDSCGLLNAHF